MGEWKTNLSLRVAVPTKAELEQFATRERRTIGNLGEVLLVWALEQLRRAGSTETLMHGVMPRGHKPDGNYRSKS